MSGDQSISWLMFFTFAAAIVAIAGGMIYFLRSRQNRVIAEGALTGTGSVQREQSDHGALPDLLGVTLFALIAMGLLTLGFKSKPVIEQKMNPPPVGQTSR